VLVEGLAAKGLVVGYDFHFGKGRVGTPSMLQEPAPGRKLDVAIVPEFRDEGGHEVSSSIIRAALGEGDIARANAALGWRWSVVSEVLHGDKRGRVLGFPTANMVLEPQTTLKQGVYAVRARIDGIWFSGAANYGRRIQFGNGPVLLETHVLDYTGDLYGKRVEIEFCGYLRPEAKFESISALVEQMGRDCDEAREIISATLRSPRGPMQAALED
jgi:riboflavin kinase/FMN adenylyltransferase